MTKVLFLYFNRSERIGGASGMLLRLASGLSKSQEVYLFINDEGILADRLRGEANVVIYSISIKNRLDFLRRIPRLIAEAHGIIRDNGIDVLWTPNVLHFIPFSLLAGRCKIVANHWLTRRSWFGRLLYLYEFLVADVMVYEYEHQPREVLLFERFIHSPKNRMIHTGHEFHRFPEITGNRALPVDKWVLGTLSSVHRRKGILDVVKALHLLGADSSFQFELLIAGIPPNESGEAYLGEIKDYITRNDLEDQVEFIGWVEEVPQYLERLDIYLLTSYAEGLAGSLREAAAMALPAVATDVGGNPEMIVDGYNGVLVEPGSPPAIAEAVRTLRSNYAKFKENALENARRIRQELSVKRFVDAYADVFDSLS